MADITVRFGDDRGPMADAARHLDYMFTTSPKELARQSRAEVVASSILGGQADTVRTDDLRKLKRVKELSVRRMQERGLFARGKLGRFDIAVDADGADPEGFDVAVRLLGVLLLRWSAATGTFVAFTLHMAQRRAGGGYEPPHFHVLWERAGASPDELREFLADEFRG